MNKKMIALAVAAGLAAPMAANAAATVYGHAQVEVASWGSDATGMSVVDNARGRIGVKASEDLGNGLKAIAKAEFKVDFSDGDAGGLSIKESDLGIDVNGDGDTKDTLSDGGVSLQKREMMVGLKGSFGEVQLGRLKSAYKYTGGVKYDPFVATVLEARGNGGMSGKEGVGAIKNAAGHNGFVSDSIGYKNKFGAVNFWLTYDLDDGGPSKDTGGNAMTLGVSFKPMKNLEIIAATVDDDNDGATGDGYSSTKFGGKWSTGPHTVKVQLEAADDAGTDVDYTYVDYNFKMGKNIIDVAIGEVDIQNVADTVDFTRIALTHKLSKKTKAWIGNRTSEQGSAKESVTSVGLQVRF